MIARSEFQIHVATVAEYAGAVEGVRELEHAIGRAKALGHGHASLEKQLARAKAGIRRFRVGHPEIHTVPDRPHSPHNGETGEGEGAGESGETTAEKRTVGDHFRIPIAWDETPGVSALGEEATPVSQPNGAGGGQEVSGGSVSDPALVTPVGLTRSGADAGAGPESSGFLLTAANLPSANGSDSTGDPAGIPASENSGGAWDAELFRREFEGMLRALLEEQDNLRARAGVSESEQEQVAARQAEMEARLREAEARLRFNRDAG